MASIRPTNSETPTISEAINCIEHNFSKRPTRAQFIAAAQDAGVTLRDGRVRYGDIAYVGLRLKV